MSTEKQWQLWRTREGDLYFFHKDKSITQWERPKFYSNNIACNDSEAWRCYKNPNKDTDFTFFYENLFTKEITWFVYEECERLIPYNVPESWIVYKRGSRETYYFNIQTKETTWSRPKWIKEDFSNVKMVTITQSDDKMLEHIDFYSDILPQAVKRRKDNYKLLFEEQTDLKHYSCFNNWYPKLAQDKRTKNIAPSDRAILFKEYCNNLSLQKTRDISDLHDNEKIKLCRHLLRQLKNKNYKLLKNDEISLKSVLLRLKQEKSECYEILVDLEPKRKLLWKALKPLIRSQR